MKPVSLVELRVLAGVQNVEASDPEKHDGGETDRSPSHLAAQSNPSRNRRQHQRGRQPIVTPAREPLRVGIAEQEQNGVIIPNKEAITLPVYLFLRDRIARIFSGGKYDLTIDTTKIMTASKINILIVS